MEQFGMIEKTATGEGLPDDLGNLHDKLDNMNLSVVAILNKDDELVGAPALEEKPSHVAKVIVGNFGKGLS